MDRTGSPVYGRQWSGGSSSSGSSSPAHPQSRLHPGAAGGFSTIKRTQNVAAKAAAQRLAQVMASQTAADDDDEEDDDLGFRSGGPPAVPPRFSNNGLNHSNLPATSITRPNRSPSPALGRNFVEHTPSVRSTSAGRPAMSMKSTPTTLMPPSRTSAHNQVTIPPIDPPNRSRDKRFTADVGQHKAKDTGDQREASALRDEALHGKETGQETKQGRPRQLAEPTTGQKPAPPMVIPQRASWHNPGTVLARYPCDLARIWRSLARGKASDWRNVVPSARGLVPNLAWHGYHATECPNASFYES